MLAVIPSWYTENNRRTKGGAAMVERIWGNAYRTTLVCVDSYQDGVMQGCLCNPYSEGESFKSLTQLLVKMESMLDEMQCPQAHTQTRTFGRPDRKAPDTEAPQTRERGAAATFQIRIIFRQHASWQGVVTWMETGKEESFRSVLELILLMDSALCDQAA